MCINNKQNKLKYENIKICLIYLITGFIWIFFSDRIINKLSNDSSMLLMISTYKGWLYVIVTSTILYLLINSFLKKVDVTEKKLNESYEELSAVNEELEAYVQQLTASEQELKAQYDQITESEEKYKTLVNEMQQGLAIFEAIINDKEEIIEYRLLYANKYHEKVTGLKNEDILGKYITEIFPSIEKSLIEKYGHIVKTGEPLCYENYEQEREQYYSIAAYRPKQLQLAVIVTDITARKQAEEVVKASEYNFRNIFEASSDGILIVNDKNVIDCNLSMVDLLGYDSKACIIGEDICKFSLEKQPDGELSEEKAFKMYKSTIENGKCKFEWWYKRVDGRLLPVEVMMTPILLSGKKVFHSLWRDISERKQIEDKMEYLSYHDQLTGLYNRRFFEEELSRLDVERNLPLTIIMGDVNGLKLVNDSFGHVIGDELIKRVVEIMIKGCRSDDIISRIGGDEFVIILPKTDIYEAEEIVKRIKALSLKEKLNSVEISISFGYETKKKEVEKIQDILKKAEDNMYKKKLLESPSMRLKTINSIITTLNQKNKREEQNNNRVSRLCQSIGTAMGLSKDEIKQLEILGLLHDIGEIAIDENILNKPGKLTDEEWEEVKRHSEIGYRILSTLNDMSETAKYVLAHHEKWNGTGYPKGLKGEEIPLQSRIITIADSYEAMISERSYRNALSEEAAIEELKINSGIQFDPELVRVFIEKVLDKPFDK